MLLSSARTIQGCTVAALDGEIGHITDLYFDDQAWVVRYLVVDTGTWLSGRSVLVDPSVIRSIDHETRQVLVDLTRERVEKSPGIDTAMPVSRQHEAEYRQYFGWPLYWENSALLGAWTYAGAPVTLPPAESVPEGAPIDALRKEAPDPHLWSLKSVTGYHIQAEDGELGHVEDFLIEQGEWRIRYMVIDTRNWWPGKRVLVAWQWIRDVSWEDRKVMVDRTREALKNGPEWDGVEPVSLENRITPV